MVPEHERGLLGVLREFGTEPRELLGRQSACVATVAGFVVGVDADHSQAMQVASEVRRPVTREELVVEAVVPLPLARTALVVRVARMGAIVIAARDEVVAAI